MEEFNSAIERYLGQATGTPFFCVVGDDEYQLMLEQLVQKGLKIVRASKFCTHADRFPDIDSMIDELRTGDIDCRENRYVVVGVGEHLSLHNKEFCRNELMRLKDLTLGNARVVFLLHGNLDQILSDMVDKDTKLRTQQRVWIAPNCKTTLSITCVNQSLQIQECSGMRNLLERLEEGAQGNIYVETNLCLEESLLSVATIKTAFEAVKLKLKYNLQENWGTEENWQTLLADLSKRNWDFNKVLYAYDVNTPSLDELYGFISGCLQKNWLFFFALKLQLITYNNGYLKYAINSSNDLAGLKHNIICGITAFRHTDKGFATLYKERKQIVKYFPETVAGDFIRANESDEQECIYRYTDLTSAERRAIIKWIAVHGWSDAIPKVYPALAEYKSQYVFDNSVPYHEELTVYFDRYKNQKVLNHLDENFVQLVEEYAQKSMFMRLDTRANAIDAIEHKNKAYLYWIDALGVEYLSYITQLAKKNGLSMSVKICRADLPTITEINKQFYDQWEGEKYKESKLDEIKHKDDGGFFFTESEYPTHLEQELEVIKKAFERATVKLGQRQCEQFVIASDHGASRLAVLKKQEEKYESETPGRHSGRCCRRQSIDGCDLPYAIGSDEYWVLANYGRFKGSRAANVEVHGGASLEEVVIPIITLSLSKQFKSEWLLTTAEATLGKKNQPTILNLYIPDLGRKSKVSIVLCDDTEKCEGKTTDGSHFSFELSSIKRAGQYEANIFDGDNLLANITITVKNAIGSVNTDFDELF